MNAGRDRLRILVMRPGALGDFIITLPLLAALRRRCPDSTTELMASPSFAELLDGQGLIDAAWSIDRAEMSGLFMPDGAAPASARRFFSQFALVVSLWRDADGRIAAALQRYVPRVVAIEPLPDATSRRHAAEQILERAVAAGLVEAGEADCSLPTLKPPERHLAVARSLLAAASPPRLAVHPGSGSPAKNWPADRFAAVVHALHRCGASVVLIEGPADAEAAATFRTAIGDMPFVELRSQPLPVLAAALSLCWRYVGNDSGISHLAAAVGLAGVAVFGPSSPDHWRPCSPLMRVVRAEDSLIARVSTDMVLQALGESP